MHAVKTSIYIKIIKESLKCRSYLICSLTETEVISSMVEGHISLNSLLEKSKMAVSSESHRGMYINSHFTNKLLALN